MKSALLIIVFTVLTTSAFSQLDKTYGTKLGKPFQKKPVIDLKKIQQQLANKPLTMPFETKHTMPIVKLEAKGKLLRNNGQGADVYVYEPDNMLVLKPDATYKSNMPVAGRNPLLIKP